MNPQAVVLLMLVAVSFTSAIPPEINPQLKNQLIGYNSSLQFNCFLRGFPTPEVNWTKDGVSLGNNNTLTIRQARLEDSGQYTCSVKNSEGSESSTFWIEVAGVSPQIIAPPTDQSVTEGYLGNFKCVASGVPTPTFVWDFNNGDLPSGIHQTDQEGESLLELLRVTKEMEGTYNCTAKNKQNIASSSAVLRVYGKASAQVVPVTNQTLTAGEVLTLNCKVNRETVNITWKKDGESFKERAVIFTRLSERRSELVITDVVEEDSGEYSCEARNKLGTVAHSSVILDVKGKASAQVVPETHQSLRAGEVLTLTCKVNRETVNITWKKYGESIKERAVIDTRLNERKSKLVITELVEEDSGEYSCEARNSLGTVAHSSVILDVIVSPQITKPPISQSVTEGHPVNFSCRASGVPTPTLVWVFNNDNLKQTDHDGESLLELPSVTKEMKGTYKCEAKNKADTTSSSATLRVYGKASAQVAPDPYPTLTAGDVLTLTCPVNEDTINVTWKKDGDSPSERAKISTSLDKKESKLTINEVLEEDGGNYSCEGRNQLGFVAYSFVKITVRAEQVSRAMQGFNSLWYYIGGSVAAVIVVSLIACFFYKRRRTVFSPDQEQAIQMEPLNVEVDKWEIEVSRVLLQEVIGRGAFGAVWRALLSSPNGRPRNRTVAAKCFTPTAGEEGRKCLMREIELGKLIGENNQPNIVKFMGCVTTQIHPILIMEYMPCGDLLGYLRKCRGVRDRYYLGDGRAQDLTNYDLVMFAKQIAAGMVFLGSRGIIHRDLAARNILLDNNYVCKVTDFGMAYQSFKYGHGNAKKGCLPIKWTAPEILLGNLAGHSTLSDVWSYGIVLYEIVTLGGIPYDRWSEGRVVAEVTKGYQMPKPDHVDKKLHDVMKRCWNFNPDFRPPFENLRQRMDKYIREETYEELLNLGAYDKKKYSRVEDLGDEDAGPSEEVAKKAAAKRLGKWSSSRR